MKKNIGNLLFIVCFLFIGMSVVDAANYCPNATKKELSRAANYVKANYEVIDNSEVKEITVDGNTTTYKVPNFAFEISIYNLTENLYAEITTTKNGEERRVYNSDVTDGVYSFIDNNAGDIYNYNITIKSDGECAGLSLKTIKFTKPRYNAYSEFAYCQNSSSYYCQKFIGTEINIKSTNEFLNKIQVNNEKNDPDVKNDESIFNVIQKNWKIYLFIFLGVLFVAGVAIIIFIILKRKKNKEWKL